MYKLTRRNFLKISALGAAGASAALMLGGCAEKDTSAEGEKHTTIKVGVSNDPKSLAPYALGNDARKMLCFHLYQAAMHTLKAGAEPIPGICESYEVDYDACTVTLKVRDGVHDHDGNDFTANDVAYSYNTTKEVANSSSYDYFTHAEATDDNTCVIYWNPDYIEKRTNIESALSGGGVYMFTQAAWEASEDAMVATPVGTGPYKCTSFSVGSKVVLEKADFWQKEAGFDVTDDYQANFETIEVSVITEASQIAIALETGDIDASANVTEQDITLFKEGGVHSDKFTVTPTEGFLGYFMSFNMHTELGGNIDFRKAVCHAVDRDGMIKTLAGGSASIMNAPFGTANSCVDYNPEWDEKEYFPYSLDTAKEHLDKYLAAAGKTAADVTVKFAVQNNANCQKPAEILQAKLIELGIVVDMKVYDAATFNTILTEPDSFDFTMFCMGTSSGIMSAWQLNDSSNYYYHWDKESPEYAELMEYTEPCMYRSTWTQEATNKLWQYVYDNAFARGLYKNYDNIVAPKWVDKVVINFNRNCMYGSFVHN